MKKLLIILIALVSLSGCDNINPKNYPFYCKIDGKEFVPEKDESLFGGTHNEPLKFRWGSNNLSVNAINGSESLFFVLIFSSNEVKLGKYELNKDSLTSKAYYSPDRNAYPSIDYISQSGHITITKIKDKNIWGEFEFVAKNTTTGKEYKITDGKFTNKN